MDVKQPADTDTASIDVSAVGSTTSTQSISRRQETMIKIEEKKKLEAAQYTFQPVLKTRRSKNDEIKHSLSGEGGSNRFEKLYHEARKRQSDQKSRNSVSGAPFPFHPDITTKAKAINRTSASSEELAERLYKSNGAGNNTAAINSILSSMKQPFKPEITKRAKSLERHQPTPDRLFSRAQLMEEKRKQLKEELAKREIEDCTFAPKTNSTAGSRSSSAQRERENKRKMEIGDRMQRYLEERAKRLEEAKKAKSEAEALVATFKPQLATKNSAVNKSLDESTVSSNVFERLISQANKEPQLMPDLGVDCTFQPNIATKKSPVGVVFINKILFIWIGICC